ncbi:MAG: hypothetical protein GY940_29995 [bacterium]|nr:hypothetical protein [bacterium]
MRKYVWILTAILVCWSFSLSPAIFEGERIDKKNFPATIQKEGIPTVYRVDVVFIGRAANIRFAVNQVLPIEASNNSFMTLYLVKDENIDDHDEVILKQVIQPPVIDDSKPEDWATSAIWIMKLDLSSLD